MWKRVERVREAGLNQRGEKKEATYLCWVCSDCDLEGAVMDARARVLVDALKEREEVNANTSCVSESIVEPWKSMR